MSAHQEDPSVNSVEPGRIPLAKRVVFALAVVVMVTVVAELTLALAGVKPTAAMRDPYVGFQSSLPLFEKAEDPNGKLVYRTAANKLTLFNEQSFAVMKEPGTYRIFCVGGSTTYGRPYRDNTSFVGWLRLFLGASDPTTDWEVMNCGGVSYASYRVAALMEELIRYEPDLFIIYTGHNEFLERRTYSDIIDEHPAVTRLNVLMHQSRTVSLMRAVIDQLREDPREAAKKQFLLSGEVRTLLATSAGLDLYYRDAALRSRILEHYQFNVGRMIALARSVGSDVVFVQPAANIKDFSPFKSQHRDGLKEPELSAWQRAFDRGVKAAKSGDHATAHRAFEDALRLDDRYAQLYFENGRVLLSLGDYAGAGRAFARAISEDVCPLRMLPEMKRILARVATENRTVLIDFADALAGRSRTEFGHDLPGEAYFLDHVHPTIAVHRLLGRLLLDHLIERGTVKPAVDWNDARAEALAAQVERNIDAREHAQARTVLARVLRWAGKVEESDRLVDEVASVLTQSAEVCVLLAQKLQREGKIDQAIEQYLKAIRLEPGLREAYTNLGSLYSKEGRLDDAIRLFRRGLLLDPGHALGHQKLATALSKQGRLAAAIDEFRRALAIEPARLTSHVNLGAILIKQGNVEAALAHFHKAVQINPRSVRAHSLQAGALVRLDRMSDALDHYNIALGISPNDAEVHYNFGVALLARGQMNAAAQYFERATLAKPDFADAHFNLGVCQAQQRQPTKAARHFERVLEINPNDRLAYENLSVTHLSNGMPAQAVGVLRRGLTSWPNDRGLLTKLAWLLATSGEPNVRDGAEAVRLAEQACSSTEHPDVHCLDVLAAAYARAGQFADAVEAARQAIELAGKTQEINRIERMQRRLDLYLADRAHTSTRVQP